MKFLVIHNPQSGFSSDGIYQFIRSVAQAGDELILRQLAESFNVRQACHDAEDYDVVIVSGGDGTVSSLLYELRGRDVSCAVFPSGTANLLYMNIGNAFEPSALARACRNGITAEVDLGEASWIDDQGERQTRGFALMAGCGFDAQIMQAAVPNKAAMGQAAYFAAVLAHPRPRVINYQIEIDGQHYKQRGITCLVGNNATIQGDIEIVPNCRMNDGILDVIVCATNDMTQLLHPLIFGLMDKTGKAIGRPHIEHLRGKEIHVTLDQPVPFEIDGDVVSEQVLEYDIRILPKAVRIIVDSMSPYYQESQGSSHTTEKELAYPKL